MIERKVSLKDEYIKLGSLLKSEGVTETGARAKLIIQSGAVRLNGEVCTMRAKKIRSGDKVEVEDYILEVL